MSEEQLKAFLEKVKGDTSLQEKLKPSANNQYLANYSSAASGLLSSITYNPRHNAGARFYDRSGNNEPDFIHLSLIDDEIIAGESYNDVADLFVLENPWRDHPGFDVADLIFTDFRISDNDRIIIAGKHLD